MKNNHTYIGIAFSVLLCCLLLLSGALVRGKALRLIGEIEKISKP
jgi:hypothetical protein